MSDPVDSVVHIRIEEGWTTMWSSIQYVGFDTETSGPNPYQAEIVSACVGDQVWLLQPTAPIPEEATTIHGITTAQATADGVDHAAGVSAIRDAIYRRWEQGAALCVFNAPYDCTLLDRECQRHGVGKFEIRGVVIDPYVIDRHVDRFRKGKRQLVDVAQHHGVDLSRGQAHGAKADADATAQLGRILAANLPEPAKANQAQADYHDAQKRSYSDWLAGRGQAVQAKLVLRDLGWPMRGSKS